MNTGSQFNHLNLHELLGSVFLPTGDLDPSGQVIPRSGAKFDKH